MVARYVYHASEVHGLKVIRPAVSTHGEKWVYAAKDLVMAALFLSGKGGDLTCAIGREGGIPYVCERFAGAFEHRYGGVSGSIYVLPGESFVEGRTGWEEEVVSEEEVYPVEEIRVEDAKGFLEELAREGKLRILLYPERVEEIPEDDEDLVYRGIVWTRQWGEVILEEFKRYHPHLISRIREGLREGRYLDSPIGGSGVKGRE